MAAPAWVTAAGVAATWTVAVIAVFGDKIRSWMNRPALRIELVRQDGDREIETLRWTENGVLKERSREARYYHLKVTNARRTAPAHEVQVVIEAIERRGPNNLPVLEYPGPLPLEWRHSQAFPPTRTVGSEAVADLLVVTEERSLKLRTTIAPNVYATDYSGPTQLGLTVVARCLERDSLPIRLKVSWDGEWNRGQTEMRNHLTIDIASI
jgi:hypothetical protein